MKHTKLIIPMVTTLFIATLASAIEEKTEKCGASFFNLKSCLEVKTPQILRLRESLNEARSRTEQARERQNPVLQLQAAKSGSNDPLGDNVQAQLLFPIDYLGVRSLRENKSQIELEDHKIQNLIDSHRIWSRQYVSLHKIRQLGSQHQLFLKLTAAIGTTIQQFNRQPRLSPEQQTTLRTLEMAKVEMEQRAFIIQQNYHALVHDIEIQIDQPWEPSKENLPVPPNTWPTAGFNPLSSNLFSTQKQLQLEKGESTSRLLKAEKSPALQIGPSLELANVDSRQGSRIGIVMQLPLKILESNSGTTKLAEATQKRIGVEAETNLREAMGEYAHNLEIYQNSVQQLKTAISADKINAIVEDIRKHFSLGLVAGPMFLEAIRQGLAQIETHHEIELRAIESWCQIQLYRETPKACEL